MKMQKIGAKKFQPLYTVGNTVILSYSLLLVGMASASITLHESMVINELPKTITNLTSKNIEYLFYTSSDTSLLLLE